MINALSQALSKISVGPDPAYGFGPGAKSGVDPQEGGPGSGRRPGGDKGDSKTNKDSIRFGKPAPIGRMPSSLSMRTAPADHNKGMDSIGKTVQVTKGIHNGAQGKVLDYDHDTGHATVSFGKQKKQIPIGQLTSNKSEFTSESKKEGGPGSGRNPEGESGAGNTTHRGARIYQSGKTFRALTPTGHNIGPFKNEDLLRSHLDKNDSSFGLSPNQKQSDEKKKEKKEAVSATSSVAQLRSTPDQRESTSQDQKTGSACLFRESSSLSFKNHRFEVELIKEGLGNFRDCFFYTKEALQRAADSKLFEGTQSFADHPSESEEADRPERSTKDILGYYEDVQFKENENGQGILVASLVVSDAISVDWATVLMATSVEYSKKFKEKDLVGLSINANGSAQPMSIEDLIKSQQLSEPVLAKLKEAMAQGITEVNVVNELKEAQSVDLVTKAGAGGRILQMLEQEKTMKKKDFREKDAMETEDGQAAAADGATPDHADAEQDKKLFAQMVKKYLGKDTGDLSDEEEAAAKHALEAHKESGMEGMEAYEAAGKHMKMAMEIGKKMAQEQASAQESEETDESDASESQTPPPSPKSSEGKKESMRQMATLSGEVAKLRETVRKYELRDYLEHKLSESGKSNVVTKKFRETLGVPKSKEQIDGTWKVFISAYEAGTEEVSADDGFFGEKQMYRESSGSPKKGLSHCLR